MAGPWKTQTGFAKAIGVNKGTLTRYLTRSDWPVRKSPPWTEQHRRKVAAWRASSLQENRRDSSPPPDTGANGTTTHTPASGENYQKARAVKTYHEARRQKVLADLAEGRVITTTLHESAMTALATVFVREGDDLAERLPHMLVGADAADADRIIKREWRALRQRVAEQTTIELDNVDQQIRDALEGRRKGRGRRGV
jgi:hypothetical protein